VTSVTLVSRSAAQTRRLGERIGRALDAGDVVLLQGELGAGKTVFAQGIGRGLDIPSGIKSSSFVLVNEYQGRLRLYHADLYRIEDPREVFDLALEETAADGVLVVEWPERAWEELPPERLLVRITYGDGPSERRVELTAEGARYEALLRRLRFRSTPRRSRPRP
jgi:tRNA threonylcarbamoyladenosine biosynthesis protein TsaE